MSALDFIS